LALGFGALALSGIGAPGVLRASAFAANARRVAGAGAFAEGFAASADVPTIAPAARSAASAPVAVYRSRADLDG
jgi:hypothetical protein